MHKFKRVKPLLFKYWFQSFRLSHFHKIVDISEGLPLPMNSIIHDIGSFSSDNKIIPDLQQIEQLFNFKGRYLIYHNNPMYDEEFAYYKLPVDRFRVLFAGMNTRLSLFKASYRNRVKIVRDLKKLNGGGMTVIPVINDNTLKSVKLTGLMTQYRLFNHLLNGMLDKIYQSDADIQHYIPIRISNIHYKQKDFQSIVKRGYSVSTIQHPHDPFYFFISSLLSYCDEINQPSPYRDVPTRKVFVGKDYQDVKIDKSITFILHTEKYACIYNLEDLMNLLNQGPAFIYKFLQHIQLLQDHQSADKNEIEIVKPSEHFNNVPEEHEDGLIDFDELELDTDEFEDIDYDQEDTTKIQLPEDHVTAPPPVKYVPSKKEIVKPEPVKKEPEHHETVKKEPEKKEPAHTKIFEIKAKEEPVKSKVTSIREPAPTTHIQISHTSQLLKSDVIIDEPIQAIIQKHQDNLTEKQKERLHVIAHKWKDLEFHGERIHDIMNETNGLHPIKEKDMSFLDSHVADKSYLKAKSIHLDPAYIEKQYKKDIIHNVIHLSKTGMFLTDVQTKVVKTSLEDYTEHVFKFEDINFKHHTVKVSLPNIRSDGTIISRGSVKKIYKQRINKPICKIGPTTVALFSDYNKYLVEVVGPGRNTLVGIINNLLNKKNFNKYITFTQGKYISSEKVFPLELTQIASGYDWITCGEISLSFNLDTIVYDQAKRMWEIGYDQEHKIFIDKDNIISFFDKHNNVTRTTTFLEIICDTLAVPVPAINQWTEVNLISKTFPVGIVLAYRLGIENLLTLINLDYDIYNNDDSKTIPKDPRLLKVKFSDVTITFPMVPYEKSFIVNGLNKFNLTKYSFYDLNEKETYYDIFSNEGYSPNYLLEINNFFDFFVDPATHEVLLHMNEPTTPEGILIRATEMLKIMGHKPPSSASNFRSRAHGKVPAILYNELTKQLAAHRRPMNKENKFSINPKAVYQRILQDALTENADVSNPIGAIKDQTSFSYVGFGGRSTESFVIKDRLYPKDAIGIVSEATVDSSIVAIRAQYSLDPNIVNLRGCEEPVDIDTVEPAQLLSISSLLFPAVTQDDGKRAGFCNIQMSQMVTIENAQMLRLRTTYEKVVPHLSKPPFVYMAEEDGKVLGIDDELGLAKIEYKSGKLVSVEFGTGMSRYSAAGMYIRQRIVMHSKVRHSLIFKKDEPIVFNQDWFQEDPFSKQIMMKIGYRAKVAMMDTDGTVDDSNMISSKLSKKLNFHPIHDRQIVLGKDYVIHSFADVGNKVSSITPLLTFEEFADDMDLDGKGYDDETMNLISKLNKKTPKAQSSGIIVDIKVHYTSAIGTMSESMQKFIKHVEKKLNKKATYTESTSNSIPRNQPIEHTDKLGMVDLTEDTVIITYYIQDEYASGSGDKLIFGSSGKSVTSVVYTDPIYTEDMKYEVDAVFSGCSFANRILYSPYMIGCSSLVIEKTQEDILKMYYGTR